MTYRLYAVSQLVQWNDDYKTCRAVEKIPQFNTDDTGMAIFNTIGQQRQLDAFLKNDKLNFLFVSEPCWNTVHPGTYRNVVVIFELKES